MLLWCALCCTPCCWWCLALLCFLCFVFFLGASLCGRRCFGSSLSVSSCFGFCLIVWGSGLGCRFFVLFGGWFLCASSSRSCRSFSLFLSLLLSPVCVSLVCTFCWLAVSWGSLCCGGFPWCPRSLWFVSGSLLLLLCVSFFCRLLGVLSFSWCRGFLGVLAVRFVVLPVLFVCPGAVCVPAWLFLFVCLLFGCLCCLPSSRLGPLLSDRWSAFGLGLWLPFLSAFVCSLVGTLGLMACSWLLSLSYFCRSLWSLCPLLGALSLLLLFPGLGVGFVRWVFALCGGRLGVSLLPLVFSFRGFLLSGLLQCGVFSGWLGSTLVGVFSVFVGCAAVGCLLFFLVVRRLEPPRLFFFLCYLFFVLVGFLTVDAFSDLVLLILSVARAVGSFLWLFRGDLFFSPVYCPSCCRVRGVYVRCLSFRLSWGFWPGAVWLRYACPGAGAFTVCGLTLVCGLLSGVWPRIAFFCPGMCFLWIRSFFGGWPVSFRATVCAASMLGWGSLWGWFAGMCVFFRGCFALVVCGGWGCLVGCLVNVPLFYCGFVGRGVAPSAGLGGRRVLPCLSSSFLLAGWAYGGLLVGRVTVGFVCCAACVVFRDDFCWARCQAWGVYGRSVSCRSARGAVYLAALRGVVGSYLVRLCAELVPFWDLIFAGGAVAARVSSSASVVACGVVEGAG
ncbi:hypothetical protein SAMN02745178_00027 [Gemmiger formicilis]|uniref:Uncharacterized protein n=1 Tax=Gemmiger formicilis TaxID=745368 RepID=A0A1T4W7B3_9FIRM|nr:hypothetical protein SAMN02745178_00027 [Gemmiger formicilis]